MEGKRRFETLTNDKIGELLDVVNGCDKCDDCPCCEYCDEHAGDSCCCSERFIHWLCEFVDEGNK